MPFKSRVLFKEIFLCIVVGLWSIYSPQNVSSLRAKVLSVLFNSDVPIAYNSAWYLVNTECWISEWINDWVIKSLAIALKSFVNITLNRKYRLWSIRMRTEDRIYKISGKARSLTRPCITPKPILLITCNRLLLSLSFWYYKVEYPHRAVVESKWNKRDVLSI